VERFTVESLDLHRLRGAWGESAVLALEPCGHHVASMSPAE
jgi:hypothetical protein